jgi:hypothetical protein
MPAILPRFRNLGTVVVPGTRRLSNDDPVL